MPTYTVKLPDGRTMKAEAPDEKTAILGAQKWFQASSAVAPSKAPVTPPLYVPDGQGGEIPLQGNDREVYERRAKAEGQETEKAKEKRIANRGIMERIGDTAAFIPSALVRTATGGSYGLGDAVGLAHKGAGENVSHAERDFAEANEGLLEPAAQFGEYSLGIPALGTMGAPLRGMGAALRTAAASPRGAIAGAIRGTGEAIEGASRTPGAVAGTESALRLPTAAGRAGQGLQAYADNMKPPAPRQPNAPPVAGMPENIQTIPEKLRDYEAFRDLDMKPFGPSLASQPTARFARTIEEIPIVGGVVRSPKQTAELEAKAAQQGLAKSLNAPGTEEAAGDLVQRGLERYRTAGMTDIDPGALRAKGIDPYQATKPAQTMTKGAAQRAADADIAAARAAGGGGVAQTSRGGTTPSARPLNQTGLRRTNAEDLSEAELDKLIRAPSHETSFPVRSEALYESANRKLPPTMRADGSRNPNMLGTPNTRAALLQTQGEVGNQLGAGQGKVLGQLADDLINSKSNFSFDKLRAIRTEVGRALSNFGDYETRLDRSQLNRIYGSISKDMEVGLTDIANRAWQRTTLAKDASDYLSPEMAKRADAALFEFRRADRYFRQGLGRMDKFMNVLQAKTPNDAARKIVTALKEKTANPAMLREIGNTLRPEELKSFQGHIISQLGSKRPGATNAESIFNWNHWATDYNAIASAPGGLEFLTKGLGKEVTGKLENLARVVNRMKAYESTTNHSGSAYSGLGIMGMASPQAAIMTLGTGALIGKALTSNAFLSWNEALMKAQLRAGNTAASNMRIAAQYAKRLPAIAKTLKVRDPDMQRTLTAIGTAIEQQMSGVENEKAKALAAP